MEADKLAGVLGDAKKLDAELTRTGPQGPKPSTPPPPPVKAGSPEDRPLDGDPSATALPPPASAQWASLVFGGAMLAAQFAPEVADDIAQAFGQPQCEAFGAAVAPAFEKWGIRPPGQGTPELSAALAIGAMTWNAYRIFTKWQAMREAEAKRKPESKGGHDGAQT